MRSLSIICLCIVLTCCDNSPKKTTQGSQVAKTAIPLTTYRFDQVFFNADPAKCLTAVKSADTFYPGFSQCFLDTIVNTDPQWTADSLKGFMKAWTSLLKPVYDSSELIFHDFSPYEKEIKNGLELVHQFFPTYPVPKKLITFIGPPNGFGYFLKEDAICIGLQFHLGRAHSFYNTDFVREAYPPYITYRFCPEYIPINCVNLLIEDMYPNSKTSSSLIIQMVEAGKKMYALSQCLPDAKEYQLIGYTEKQLEDCYDREAFIWNFFVKNDLLQSTEKSLIENYLNEGPKTEELGEASPGKIAVFSGWQLVKKYMKKHPETTLPNLFSLDEEKIIQEAKYKP